MSVDTWRCAIVAIFLVGPIKTALAENIDPLDDGSQYCWAENVGWLNAEPLGDAGSGVLVSDFELTGWMWGENIGWVSLSCENTSTCGTIRYGVFNDTFGNLFGFAWGENVGWMNFRPSTAGVTVDPTTGDFSGRAWGENIGWISFASSGPVAYKVKTAWRCDPNPGPVGDSLQVTHDRSSGITSLAWLGIPGAAQHNTYRGTIPSTTMATRAFPYDHFCYESNDTFGDGAVRSTDSAVPVLGESFYYLVTGEIGCEGSLGNASNGSPRSNFAACRTTP